MYLDINDSDDVPFGDAHLQEGAHELLVQHEVLLPGQVHGRPPLPDHLPPHLRPHHLLHDGPALRLLRLKVTLKKFQSCFTIMGFFHDDPKNDSTNFPL